MLNLELLAEVLKDAERLLETTHLGNLSHRRGQLLGMVRTMRLKVLEEYENVPICDECGLRSKSGNVVYHSDGRRPLCKTCNKVG